MSYRSLVIGTESWDEGGRAQLDFLLARGLRPEHFVLDMGCGPFRLGKLLVDYLEPGHYAGVDSRQEALDVGVVHELGDLISKAPRLLCCSDFDLSPLADLRFDFAWSYSLLTHLDAPQIVQCVRSVLARLAQEGAYFATYDRAPGSASIDHGTWVEHSLFVMEAAARAASANVAEVSPALVPQLAPTHQVVLKFTHGC